MLSEAGGKTLVLVLIAGLAYAVIYSGMTE
jgi:hypothetical protein